MDRYGLIGASLKHSFSQAFFTRKFAEESIDATYSNFELADISELRRVVGENRGLRGLNVTIPYKRDVIALLDEIDPVASRVGAVNTIAVRNDGRLAGYNTDIEGFRSSIGPMLSAAADDADSRLRALILGTGGASAAVAEALRTLAVESVKVSRTPKPGCLTYDDLTEAVVNDHRVVVNTTPLGTYPDTTGAPPFPYGFLTPRHICHDLVYNPAVTRFMELASARGAAVKNGYEMLVGQALASWKIWNSSLF